ncbi:TetR/AcrR family transcriptional regulator [Athalassotoga saccharophila]|uniref:TetR/AcrR family transcriptional regulator n=1 Tax=Athalassotoga saccharophila TaxID=1441386 RepID=UPI00137B391A|nr:TetR/AcrR family transcriptional regulator [Athalassotoga saccharophila]BBJ28110.1 putative HTH-type transcriptional regulator YvdT [Athalassotoga saccharophila]
MQRMPVSQRGKETYKKIIQKSIELFSEKGYQEVSAAMISKSCGIGNASFYQYFSSKEEVLYEIVRELTESIKENVKKSMDSKVETLEERLKIFIESLTDLIVKDINAYTSFRNAEFLFPEISEGLYEEIYSILSSEFLKNKDENTRKVFYIFVMGIINFVVNEYTFCENKRIDQKVIDSIVDLILYGLDPDTHNINKEAFLFLPRSEDKKIEFHSQWSLTHRKILKASEDLFGNKGYSNSKISEIAALADVGLGTFYVHFDSKIEALRELVASTLEDLKANLRRYVWRFTDRRDAEIAGYAGFIDFFRDHREMYSIVREMEFVDSKTEIFYYSEISRSYIKPLERAFKNHEYREFDPALLSYMLMGIGHQLGLELLIGREFDEDKCIDYLRILSVFLMHGLKGMEG